MFRVEVQTGHDEWRPATMPTLLGRRRLEFESREKADWWAALLNARRFARIHRVKQADEPAQQEER